MSENVTYTCSYDVAGTWNVPWMLIVAIFKTGGDHSGNVFGIFK